MNSMRFKLAAVLSITCLFVCTIPAIAQQPNSKQSLRVLTFNAWMVKKLGLSISSKEEIDRVPLIVDAIVKSKAEIVALQEVWNYPIRDQLLGLLKKDYPFQIGDDRIVGMGHGLMLLSKYPFQTETKVILTHINAHYPLRTETRALSKVIQFTLWEDLDSSIVPYEELLTAKGAFSAVVLHPVLGPIDLFAAHLGAVYFDEETNDYVPEHVNVRLLQAQELSSFIAVERTAGRPAIVLVDLNNHFHEWDAKRNKRIQKMTPEYQSLTSNIGFIDSYMEANDLDPVKSPMEQLNMASFDTINNPYAREGHFKIPPEFIDYVFYRSSKIPMKAVGAEFFGTQPLTINGHEARLSDHYGVLVDFEFDVK